MKADPRRLLRHVEALSCPRPTGSPAEAGAARYAREALARWGIESWEETFTAVADMNWFPISAAAFALLAIPTYFALPWLGAAISAMAPYLLWYALTRADSPLRFLLPRVRSGNVVARVPPRGDVRRRAVVLAHLDTNRCRLAWEAKSVSTIVIGTTVTLAAYLLEVGVLFIGALSGTRVFGYAALPLGLYAAAVVGFLLWELRMPFSPGANDNASAVAVALELVAGLVREPLDHTEVWVCFTGAEEVDHRGAKELLRRHPELRDAYFLVLEGVGAGKLTIVKSEGILFRYRPDPELFSLAMETAGAHPEWGVTSAPMTIVCETQALRRRGCRALTLAGRDPATGTLPRWHAPDDLPEHISTDALGGAWAFLGALLSTLDGL